MTDDAPQTTDTEPVSAPPVSDEQRSSKPLRWEYSGGHPAALAFRGFPEQYDLNYIVLAQLNPDPDEEELIDFLTLASEDPSLIRAIELQRPPSEINTVLRDTRIDLQLDGTGIDNQVVYDKFRKLFMDRQFRHDLSEQLRNDEVNEARQFLEDEIRKRVFPVTEIEQEIRIYPWVESAPEQFDGEAKQDTDADSSLSRLAKKGQKGSRMLTVTPRVRPFLGTEIGKLQPGDILEVRVTGDSALRLRRKHLDPSSSDERPYTHPLEARMVAIEQGKVPQEIRFLVELSDGIYGIGSVARDTRVFYNDQLVRVNEPPLLKGLRMVLFICSIMLFASLLLLFVVV